MIVDSRDYWITEEKPEIDWELFNNLLRNIATGS